ncbi:MAG: MG2 domain-containing protein, partial [Firmicutes bacterium]|nr:MG2 domain-containing protein [Bacillota bacterium]
MKTVIRITCFLFIMAACLSGRSFAGDVGHIRIDFDNNYSSPKFLYLPDQKIFVSSHFSLKENVKTNLEKKVSFDVYRISQYKSWQEFKIGHYFDNESFPITSSSSDIYRQYKKNIKFDRYRRAHVEFTIDPLPPGTYRITAVCDDAVAYNDIIVSKIGVLAKKDRSKILIFAQDVVSGEPIADATVKIGCSYSEANEGGFGDTQVYYRGITNGDGLAEVSLKQLKSRKDDNSLVVIVSKGEDENYAYLTNNQELQFKAYIYTDRPVYRPGQTVKIKGIIRVLKNGEYVWKKGQKTAVNIFDSNDTS